MNVETPGHEALLEAALAHVPFDGWSAASFEAAARDVGVGMAEARAIAPRGALDLAVAHHRSADAAMWARLAAADLGAMGVSERVSFAVRARIEAIGDKEVVRKATAFFALPQNAPEGARLIWQTADAIWDALNDPSRDFNWYSKRTILAGVYSSTLLFWLGDESPDHTATWDFLARRIDDIARFERLKGGLRRNPLTKGVFGGLEGLLGRVQAPSGVRRADLPGQWPGAT
ncbi:MAG: COQ9 family protein [Rhodobacteraceae bacterium]|nr:COQ9 family protein [Paracoccaceae bacterium]